MDSDFDRHGHMTNENIYKAMQQLHMPKRYPKGTLGEFESQMAASGQMCAELRNEERAEW